MKDYDKLLRETAIENNQVEYETYFHLANFQKNNEYKTDDLDYQVHERVEEEGFEIIYFKEIDMYGFKNKN